MKTQTHSRFSPRFGQVARYGLLLLIASAASACVYYPERYSSEHRSYDEPTHYQLDEVYEATYASGPPLEIHYYEDYSYYDTSWYRGYRDWLYPRYGGYSYYHPRSHWYGRTNFWRDHHYAGTWYWQPYAGFGYRSARYWRPSYDWRNRHGNDRQRRSSARAEAGRLAERGPATSRERQRGTDRQRPRRSNRDQFAADTRQPIRANPALQRRSEGVSGRTASSAGNSQRPTNRQRGRQRDSREQQADDQRVPLNWRRTPSRSSSKPVAAAQPVGTLQPRRLPNRKPIESTRKPERTSNRKPQRRSHQRPVRPHTAASSNKPSRQVVRPTVRQRPQAAPTRSRQQQPRPLQPRQAKPSRSRAVAPPKQDKPAKQSKRKSSSESSSKRNRNR